MHQSPLYCLTSKKKLAAVLELSPADLIFVARLSDNYREWELKQKPQEALAGFEKSLKPRKIQQPKAVLNGVQKRICALLSRIEKPEYVYSATRKRSYLDNAVVHKNGHSTIKVDIKSFYGSVRERCVRNFFHVNMKCSSDVAHLLAKLCCFHGALPTGSSVSPVLSYFAYFAMFERLATLAKESELEFSLYVDDMVFSGERADRRFLGMVCTELAKNHLIGHKIACFGPGQPKVITGVAVWADGVGVPFSRQKRIRFFERAFNRARSPEHVELLGKTLMGQYREAERIQPGSRMRALPVEARLLEVRSARGDPPKARPKRRRQPASGGQRKRFQSLAACVGALRDSMSVAATGAEPLVSVRPQGSAT